MEGSNPRKDYKMKITISKIIESSEAINTLAQAKLRASSALKVARVLKKIQAEYETFNQQRAAFIEKHNIKGVASIPAKHLAEWQELLDVEVDLDVEQLPASELGDAQISGGEMLALEWLIVAE